MRRKQTRKQRKILSENQTPPHNEIKCLNSLVEVQDKETGMLRSSLTVTEEAANRAS